MFKFAGMLVAAMLCLVAAPLSAQTQLVMVTGPIGGSWYPIGTALVEILQSKASISFTQQPGGGVSNALNVGTGKAHVGFTTAGVAASAVRGTYDFKGRAQENLRLLAALYPQQLTIVVWEDSPIRSIADLKGRVLQTTARGTSTELMVRRMLEAHGLTYKDMQSVSFSNLNDGANQMKDGQVDAMAQLITNPTSFALDLSSSRNVRLVSLSDAMIKKLSDTYPGYVRMKIKGGLYAGQPSDAVTIGEPVVLVARAELDDELVYKMMKTLFENADQLASVYKVMANFTPAAASADPVMPVHPGALRYYKEAGVAR